MSKICGTPSVNHAFYVDGNSTHKFNTQIHHRVIRASPSYKLVFNHRIYICTPYPPQKKPTGFDFLTDCVLQCFLFMFAFKNNVLIISHLKTLDVWACWVVMLHVQIPLHFLMVFAAFSTTILWSQQGVSIHTYKKAGGAVAKCQF